MSDNLAQDSFAAVYATLQTLPFAQRYGESGHALHDLTRAGLIGYLLREQPDDFRAYSRRAARFFAERDAIECVYHLLASDTAAGIGWFEKLTIELCEQRRDLSGAHRLMAYLRELLAAGAATSANAERALSFGYSYLGDLQMNYASVSAAAESYQQSLAIRERLAQADPANAEAQRDLSVSYNKIGNAQMTLGDTAAQRALSISYSKIGDAQMTFGDTAAAVAAYQQSLAIRERLAQADPANAAAQRDLSVSYNKIGNTQMTLGDTAAQRDLSISYSKIGDAQMTFGDTAAQRDLSISYSKIGDAQMTFGDTAAAVAAYQQSLAIRERLAQADPANAAAQRDLAVSYWKLGWLEENTQHPEKALQWYQQALPIAERLARQDPANAQAQSDLKWLQDAIKRAQGGQA